VTFEKVRLNGKPIVSAEDAGLVTAGHVKNVRLVGRSGTPSWLICHTIKGKGVNFMENTVSCHYGSVDDRQLAQALRELEVSP
jgi:transketolase